MAKPTKVLKKGKAIRRVNPDTDAIEYKYKIRYKNPDGKWTSGYIWASDEKAAYAGTTKREQTPEEKAEGLTWQEGLDFWLNVHDKPGANQRADDTIYAMRLNVGLFIDHIGKHVIVSKTTKAQINGYLLTRSEVSGTTANHARKNVLALANWLRKFHDVPFPWHNDDFATFTHKPERERTHVDIDLIPKYISALEKVPQPPEGEKQYRGHPGKFENAPSYILRFIFLTGVRSSEACNLDESNFDGRVITFRQKGNRLRQIVCVPAVIKVIKDSIKAKKTSGITHSKIFFNTLGKPWNRTSLRHCWDRRIKAAGLPKRVIHEVRHTFCSLAADGQFSEKMIATASGHESLEVLRKYTHAMKGMQEQVSQHVADTLLPKLY